ncbi:hypothetical protein [Anaerotruncus rubiinfantis]|uniref:hypothetical protein n=1 Tax=Anaerotruncus rubiinfantis TaxID=1720200 RepID=UPI0011C8BFF1|nr:hypothetical protein [Anaerotruncus rubiinfantis]
MNNEDKILEMLGTLVERQDRTETILQQIIARQDKTDLSIMNLQAEMNERFDKLESDMKFAWQDIALVEKRIKQHEKEYHEAV